MEVNYFQIALFLILLSLMLFFWYKYKLLSITNFFLGGVILIVLCHLSFLGFNGKLDIFSFSFIIIAFIVLNISSLLTYLFKDYKEKYFFVFPTTAFIIISFFFNRVYNEPQDQMLLIGVLSRLFVSFFPLLYYTYFLKFKKKE